MALIRQLVNFALARGMVGHDPLRGFRLQSPPLKPQPCWTPADVQQILSAAADRYRNVFTFLAETGCRIGEVQWLTWDDIDLEQNVIHIRSKPGWTTKTGNARAIPMSQSARALLEPLPRSNRWVFVRNESNGHPSANRQICPRRLLKSLKRTLEPLGLKGHLHTFRHSFISKAIIGGTPEAVIRQWVGHVDQETLRLYTHIADRQSQQAMKNLESLNPQPEERQS